MGSLGRFAELALWDAIHVELAIDQAGYGMSDRNVDLTLVVFASDYLEDLRDCLAALTRQLPDSLVYQTVVVIGARGEPIDFSGWAVPPHLRWVRASDEDLGSGWNRGAEAANGDVLLFLRSDINPTPHLIAVHREAHARRVDVVALGLVQPQPSGRSPESDLVALWRESLGNSSATNREISVLEFAGQTLSMRSETFRTVGPFCTGVAWGAEVEMAFRARKRGRVLLRLADLVGHARRPMRESQILGDVRKAGASSLALYRRTPELLPTLELGNFQRGSPAGVWLQRLLLALGGPSLPLGLIRRLLPREQLRVRLNRFYLSYQYWRGVRNTVTDPALWRSLTRAPIILMYHAVAQPGESSGRFIVSVRQFRRQMAWLRRARYRVLGLEELLEYRREHRLPPGRSVVLTFDDGYADNRQLAFPILQAHDFTAIFFLVTATVGGKNTWDDNGELAGRSLLSWSDIREMLSAGMQVGAHTRHHVALPTVTAAEAEQEIVGSRADLERELGSAVRAFAYPYGLLDETIPDLVARAGFDGACCSRSGPNSPVVSSYLLRRLEIRGTDSLLQFVRALGRGYMARQRTRR
jgi:peptidoglycan/xylan/chitin deacetylase (PgdA/CDA1 family)/GT2 family glycosyltransferase